MNANRHLLFYSYKGASEISTLDGVTIPPELGMTRGMKYHFGEWLKREGHDWGYKSDEDICRLAVDYFNSTIDPIGSEPPRRFHRLMSGRVEEKLK